MTRELTKADIKEVQEHAEKKGLKFYEKTPGIWVIYKEAGKDIDYLFKGEVVDALIFLINYKGE